MKKILVQGNKKGFVILFASMIATIIMVISFAMASVSIKSTALATTSSEALTALYAADAGIDCALQVMNPPPWLPVVFLVGPPPMSLWSSPFCGNTWLSAPPSLPLTSAYTFDIEIRDTTTPTLQSCASISIEQDVTVTPMITTVYARGYSRCNGSVPDVNHPRFLERTMEVEY
jgi:hypothetical protein